MVTPSKGVFGWFNRALDGGQGRLRAPVGWSLKRTGRLMLIYAALLVGLCWAFVRLPGGFLPVDDQGFITTDVQTPPDSSYGTHRGRDREGRELSGASGPASTTSRSSPASASSARA